MDGSLYFLGPFLSFLLPFLKNLSVRVSFFPHEMRFPCNYFADATAWAGGFLLREGHCQAWGWDGLAMVSHSQTQGHSANLRSGKPATGEKAEVPFPSFSSAFALEGLEPEIQLGF